MFKNYLLVAIRNLKKNKAFSFINILGLALGLACSLLIFLWVTDERNMDKFNKNGQHLYSVYERQYFDNRIEAFHGTPGILGDQMKIDLPEVKYASGFAWNDLSTFQVGDKIMKEEGNHAGADFFKMFEYKLLEGNADNALNTPVSIAISRKMANDFFGSPEAAIGKTIRYANFKDLTVTAVFENLPNNSSLKFDYLVNWQLFLEEQSWAKEWGNNGPKTYITLRSDADPVAFEKKIVKYLDKYNKEQSNAFRIEMGIQRFDDMYLHSSFNAAGEIKGGRIEYVRLFSLVALFILIIACINFMNLTTARSVKRAKEIGIRKVVGAFRSSLIRQFIGEAILLTAISMIIALLVVVLLLPFFNQMTGKQIHFPYAERMFWAELTALILVTGFFAGSYPALFLSGFNPVSVLKGTLKLSPWSAWFRKGLVIFQFGLSIILIIGTIVVSRQINFLQTTDLGYNRENLIYIPLEGDLAKQYQLFKQKGLTLTGVKYISRISQPPTSIQNGTGGVEWEGKDPNVLPMFTQAAVGYDFAKTLDVKILKGRDFSRDFPTDSVGYLVNEQALKKIGYKDPIGKPLTFWQRKGTIIGVIKDFHFNSLREPINALIIRHGELDGYGSILVKTEAGKTKQALAGLEKLCKELNPKFPFTYQFSDEEYSKLYKSEMTTGKLADWFAFLAIFISCLGLLGLAMFTAEQKVKEIGIRKVLGASIPSLFVLLSKEFLLFVVIAMLLATPIAWVAMNEWLKGYAYKIQITWWMFLIAGAAALLIALFTVSFQAVKAAVANPTRSLRSE